MEGTKNKGCFTPKDYTGYKGEHFRIIKDTGKKTKNGSHIWEAKCECGKTFFIESGKIKRKKSCGCKNSSKPMNWKDKSVRGFKVLEKTEKRNNGYSVWKAQCEHCGDIKEFPSYYFTREHCSCECQGWQDKYADSIGRKPLPDHQSHVNIIYGHYKRSAKDRNLPFELTKDDVRNLVEQKCHYCGQEPVIRHTATGCAGEYAWNGIDRVDNTKGYTVENCVPCCKQCNFAKRDLPLVEFQEWLKRAYSEMSKKGVIP